MYKLFTLTVLNVVIFISHQHGVAAINYGTCESQFNSSGLCLQVADCQFIFDMFVAETITPENEVLLKNSNCGMDNTYKDLSRRILVCCPNKVCNESTPPNQSVHLPGDVLPDAGTCGRALSPYIYGGEEADIDEYPWMALIQYKTPSNQFGFFCGGSLINSRYVLTAAHCLYKTSGITVWDLHSVRLGEWDLNTDPDCVTDSQGNRHCAPPVIDVPVESKTPHPDYQRESRDQYNDIALLRLKESVTFTKFVRPICLMDADDLCSYLLPVGTATEVAGWGATEKYRQNSAIKLKITINITDTNKCHRTYRAKLSIDSRHHLCAGGSEGVDACGGDSGGPMMLNQRINHRDVYFAVGVTSLGPTPCGAIGWPGVYSRVCNYMEWIKQTLRP